MPLDGLVFIQQFRLNALRLVGDLLFERVELHARLLVFLVVNHLDAVELRAGLGGAHANLALLAVAGLGILAHLGKLALISGNGRNQLLERGDLLLRLLQILGAVRLKVSARLGDGAVQALDLVGQRFHAVAHDIHIGLDLLEHVLLFQQEIAVLEQFLAVAAAAHLLFILIQLHVHLLILPQKFVLFQNMALLNLSAPEGIVLQAENRHVIL